MGDILCIHGRVSSMHTCNFALIDTTETDLKSFLIKLSAKGSIPPQGWTFEYTASQNPNSGVQGEHRHDLLIPNSYQTLNKITNLDLLGVVLLNWKNDAIGKAIFVQRFAS